MDIYEKKYKEAQGWIEKIYPTLQHEQQMEAEAFFPELKESENEKIRQAIHIYLDWLDGHKDYQPKGDYTIKDMVAWLEKQGKETSWKPSKEEMDVLYGLAYITNQYDEHKEEVITRLYQDLKREFFNGSSYENMFPTNTSTEDDVRRRSTIQVLEYARSLDAYNQYGKADIDKNIAWLEKQGEQKFIDKVEPKFKVGEWVVQENIGVYKVIEVCESWYEVVDNKDKHYSIGFDKEYMCHLYTIQDAKDGDVLCDITNKNVLIFNEISNGWVRCLCSVHLEDSCCLNCTELYGREEQCSFAPATKEQRDLLFQKMHEAGYEWDAENKQLKKISQRMISAEAKEAMYAKPAWSEEDERLCSCLIEDQENALDEVRNDKYGHSEIISDLKEMYRERIDWLKSLKDRYTWKPSDEQIKVCKEVYADLLSAKGFNLGTINSELNRLEEQLKKLKD